MLESGRGYEKVFNGTQDLELYPVIETNCKLLLYEIKNFLYLCHKTVSFYSAIKYAISEFNKR